MLIHENVPAVDFKGFKRVEPVDLNSSRLRDANTCLELYRLKHVLGYKPEDEVYIKWGAAFHKFMEVLELKYQLGLPFAACVGMAIVEGMKIWNATSQEGEPGSKYAYMTKDRLSDLFVFASNVIEREKNDDKLEVLSVEESFNLQLPSGQWITGTPDQQVRWNGRRWGRDWKTTSVELKWYARRLFPADQFARYTYAETRLAGESVHGQLVDIFFLTKDKGPLYKREIISYTPEMLTRWERDQEFYKHVLAYARQYDNYPMNTNNCAYCPFRPVCISQTQAAKEYELKSKYKFAPWDNTTRKIVEEF